MHSIVSNSHLKSLKSMQEQLDFSSEQALVSIHKNQSEKEMFCNYRMGGDYVIKIMPNFLDVDDVVLHKISSFLSHRDHLALSATCQKMHSSTAVREHIPDAQRWREKFVEIKSSGETDLYKKEIENEISPHIIENISDIGILKKVKLDLIALSELSTKRSDYYIKKDRNEKIYEKIAGTTGASMMGTGLSLLSARLLSSHVPQHDFLIGGSILTPTGFLVVLRALKSYVSPCNSNGFLELATASRSKAKQYMKTSECIILFGSESAGREVETSSAILN